MFLSHPLSSLSSIICEVIPKFPLLTICCQCSLEIHRNMSSVDSRKYEGRQISQPMRLAANIASSTDSSHGNNLSRNGTKLSEVFPSSDPALSGASSIQLPISKSQDRIDGGVVQSEGTGRCFSLEEVLIATNNFDDAFVIGIGGFGKVYKGFIDGTTMVAMKRLNAESKQGAGEFWTEIKLLSKLRHTNLVALIGYCNECQEMILVYEYIALGTLADHLYKLKTTKSNTSISPPSWERRLDICIGAARGLDHLHSGTNQSFIHRDVKTTNILIDENWVAKISDFGLTKGFETHSMTHVSTNVKGTFGYLDPDYFRTQRLTTKSDVYAFGVVLLEVLCGRPPVDRKLSEEQIGLVYWAQQCIKKGKLAKVIDPSLSGQIVPRCLKSFIVLANNCLHESPKSRPVMAKVLGKLELALLSQQRGRTEGIMTKAFQSMMDGWLRERKDNSSSDSKTGKQLYRQFSLADIRIATQNFNERFLVQNSDKVYKGRVNIDGKPLVVAILRFKNPEGFFDEILNELLGPSSDDIHPRKLLLNPDLLFQIEYYTMGIKRFRRLVDLGDEIHSMKLLLHHNILSPIGFCTKEDQFIFVYDYMENGSLQDHLHHAHTPLSWKRRLQICIGAAQGLEYLIDNKKDEFIHRCIEPSSILLDKNWVAKVMLPDIRTTANISAGLLRSTAMHNSIYQEDVLYSFLHRSTAVHNSIHQEDVLYSFGVTLLEVLISNDRLGSFIDERRQLSVHGGPKHPDAPLKYYLADIIQSEKIYEVMDPHLRGKIGPECLSEFVKIPLSCLSLQGIRRPSIGEVVRSLQFALHLQEN